MIHTRFGTGLVADEDADDAEEAVVMRVVDLLAFQVLLVGVMVRLVGTPGCGLEVDPPTDLTIGTNGVWLPITIAEGRIHGRTWTIFVILEFRFTDHASVETWTHVPG